MKKIFLVVFCLFTLFSFGQKINEYEFVIVPTRFQFQESENEYRLNTLVKFRLEQYGFKAFYSSDELKTNYDERCRYLNVDVVNVSGLFSTKLYIVFKDCKKAIIFQSAVGSSKVKEYKKAYTEALEEALQSVKALNYNFEGKKTEEVFSAVRQNVPVEVEKTEIVMENALFAQPISNGFQLVDTTPKVVLKMFRTSQTDYYTATSETKNGVVFKKNSEWFFEYYVNDQLISEKLTIKF